MKRKKERNHSKGRNFDERQKERNGDKRTEIVEINAEEGKSEKQ